MTLEEAIRHCYETAERENCECSSEHLQLAHWLEELQRYRSAGKTKEKMTNEEWFCRLSTVEKAKTIICLAINSKKRLTNDTDVEQIIRWLQEEHK